MKPDPPPLSRNLGIDVARGLAVLLMIETHAYDGWVSAAGKATSAYHLSRVLSNIPAALFLLLAGVGLAIGGARRPAGAGRGGPARRALEVVGYGYLVSLVYAAIEGVFPAAELLRADILHCIGLSMLLCVIVLLGRPHPVLRAAILCVTAIALSLLVPRVLPPLPAALRVPAALLYDISPYSRFPLLPLCAFCAIGFALGDRLARGVPGRRACLVLAAGAALLAVLFTWATVATVEALGGRLSRSHPAVAFNVLNGACRALSVLFLALAWAGRGPVPGVLTSHLGRLGRGSLLAYAVHIPLCYGRLSAPLAGRLGMGAATAAVLALMLATYGVVRLRDLLRARRRR